MDGSPRVELNMNLLPRGGKHATIFLVLDALAPGESMRLFVDHDPTPLRRRLAAERPNGFEWAYEEEGPELWRVVLGRK
jgi:uncharacterized protein (DUF2249 family)